MFGDRIEQAVQQHANEMHPMRQLDGKLNPDPGGPRTLRTLTPARSEARGTITAGQDRQDS
jgi:hypothetical protein